MRTASRYIRGHQLPGPARFSAILKILNAKQREVYPVYYLDFHNHRARKHGEWWNNLAWELVAQGWSTKKLAERCGISLGRANNLLSWHYPPTEKMLRKLEKGLRKKREEFWRDWKHQQWEHFRLRKMISRDFREGYR